MADADLGRRAALLGMLGAAGTLAAAGAWAQGTAAGGAKAPSRVVLLGTKAGPRVVPGGRGMMGSVVIAGGVPYVVDCGYGVTEKLVRAGVPLAKLRHIFITHHHSDHVIEYPTLFLLAWASGLSSRVDTWGPPPIEEATRLAFAANVTDIEVRMAEEGRPDPRKLVFAHDLPLPGAVMQDENVRVTSALVDHGPIKPAYAYRFDMADRSVVFSGDTTYFPPLVDLARGADVLVHESMYFPAVDKLLAANPNAPTLRQHMVAGHTSPEDAGRIAAAAGVKKLVFSHISPVENDGITEDVWITAARKTFGGEIVVGRDMMEF